MFVRIDIILRKETPESLTASRAQWVKPTHSACQDGVRDLYRFTLVTLPRGILTWGKGVADEGIPLQSS